MRASVIVFDVLPVRNGFGDVEIAAQNRDGAVRRPAHELAIPAQAPCLDNDVSVYGRGAHASVGADGLAFFAFDVDRNFRFSSIVGDSNWKLL